MFSNKFQNKKIAILGFGIEGISSAKFLLENGAIVEVRDRRELSDLDEKEVEILKKQGAKFTVGDNYLNNLSDFDYILRSPGIHKNTPELLEAAKKGVVITSQTNIFFDLCPCPIIGVTGTKGKGTTSTLVYEILKKEKRDVYLGGNIGNPPFSFLQSLNSDSQVVLELSSFQLQDLKKSSSDAKDMEGKPHIAVMLMTVPEHLDYHSNVEEYIEAKRNIFRFQTSSDFAILNIDYPPTRESDLFTDAQIYHVSRVGEVDQGCFVKLASQQGGNDAVWLKMNGKTEKVIEIKDVKLPGKHNLENICAAILAAILAGARMKSIVAVLKDFSGLPHRLELVATVGGVKYYDDSFSTTPQTAIAAIEAFMDPKILILGGSSKKSDFEELGRIISESNSIKAIIGIGEEWEQIKSHISNSKIEIIEGCKNMQEIVKKASEIGELGDVVLLSPACASFGMFANYKDRGEQFKVEVKKILGK